MQHEARHSVDGVVAAFGGAFATCSALAWKFVGALEVCRLQQERPAFGANAVIRAQNIGFCRYYFPAVVNTTVQFFVLHVLYCSFVLFCFIL